MPGDGAGMTVERVVEEVIGAHNTAAVAEAALSKFRECLQNGDWEKAEEARITAVAAYEAYLDALFALNRMIAGL